MIECQTCHGRYEPMQRDGTLYFHRCPPLSEPELKGALSAGTVQLSKPDADRLAAAQLADTTAPPAGGAIARADLVLASLTVDRPNVRDENVRGGRDPAVASQVKAAGAGTRPVT